MTRYAFGLAGDLAPIVAAPSNEALARLPDEQ
jgi:hypothetical protein